jgi:probable addiction module antidote protein
MSASRPFTDLIDEMIQDPNDAAEYLTACLQEGEDVFMLALGDVARVHGMSTVAGAAELNRESLYKSLSGKRSPRFSSIEAILNAVGLRIRIEPKNAA